MMAVPIAPGAGFTRQVVERLSRALGPDVGQRTAREAMDRSSIDDIRTPNDLLRVADYLVTLGGVPEAVGRALRVTALLRGAGR